MNFDYRVPTGIIIKEYLDEEKISNKELSEIIGVDEEYISEVFNGKAKLTPKIIKGLEKVLPEISSEYWYTLEDNYEKFIEDELVSKVTDESKFKSISERFRFKEVFKGLNWSLAKQADEMLNILKIRDFDDFDIKYSDLQVNFFQDGGEKEAIAIWLSLCEEEAEFQDEDVEKNEFSKEALVKNLKKFKSIANNDNLDNSIKSCKKLCNRLGIYFVELEAITNCKVRGALTTYNNHPAIFISRRFKTHDHTWFAIAHEIGHLIHHYKKGEIIISSEDDSEVEQKEIEANLFARNLFIEDEIYNKFTDEGNFTERSIENFSAKNRIQSGILVARLQHDGYLKRYEMNHKKVK